MTFLFGAGYWHAPIRPRLGYVLVSLRAYASFLVLDAATACFRVHRDPTNRYDIFWLVA